jgi:hypothetical protein
VIGDLKKADIVDRLKHCLSRAIERFNSTDAATLLCPRKDKHGSDVAKGQTGWGAASERAIAHRLAVYLESELHRDGFLCDRGSMVVDCEYNRHRDRAKTHCIPEKLVCIVEKAKRTAKPDSDDDSFYVFSIAPDIVVHQRGSDENNLLVVEVKKFTNLEIPQYDHLKLACFTRPPPGYGYKLGAAVTVEDNVAPANRRLLPPKWFANGAEVIE